MEGSGVSCGSPPNSQGELMPNEKSKLRRLAGRLAAALPSILKNKKKSVLTLDKAIYLIV